ncbi:hypothetical protein R6Q57_011401 [Mikania cordata]
MVKVSLCGTAYLKLHNEKKKITITKTTYKELRNAYTYYYHVVLAESTSEDAQVKIEETSGSESESLSDSDTQFDSDADADIEDPPTQFALMVNSSDAPAANSQSDQVLSYQNHNASLISDLNQCIDANKVLKANEKDFQAKIELLNRQLHEVEIDVLNKQDAITSYLNTINEVKKKLAIVECDYETLGQKLKSYESASYIIEHMISKGADHKGPKTPTHVTRVLKQLIKVGPRFFKAPTM